MDADTLLGTVPYLNAEPLLQGLSCTIQKEVPSQLWHLFQAGKFDAALLSTYNALHLQEEAIVDGVAIASRGAVYSVILVYEGALKNIQHILLDPSSHTSNHLLQIILKEFYGFTPTYLTSEPSSYRALSRMIIGDPAIAFRQNPHNAHYSVLDLGEEWFRFTQLPFVFALWCLKNPPQPLLVEQLQQARSKGLSRLEELAQRHADPDFVLRYWRDSISYHFDEEEWKGLRLFAKLLQQHKLLRKKK